jgi:hypothetical protein
MKPYISVVVIGRNDDYGVNFMSRINTFVKSLDWQMRADPDLLEIVVVEWNPLPERDRLQVALTRTENLCLRVITVSPEIHADFHTQTPVLEFPAKNVGVRRSHGEYVLVTNPDIIFSDDLIDVIKQRTLQPEFFYRTDRFDFVGEGIQHCPAQEYSKFAAAHTFQGHLSDDQCYRILPGSSVQSLPRSQGHRVHTNGSGDFILAANTVFDQINGLFESATQLHHCDSISVIRLHHNNIKQQILTAPQCIFHWDHPRGPRPAWNAAVAWQLGSSRGADDWGLPDLDLEQWSNRS